MNQEQEQKPQLVQNEFSEEFLEQLVDVARISVRLYTRGLVLIGLTATLFVLSMGSRPIFWSAIAISAVLVAQYLRVRGLGAWLTIERHVGRAVVKKGDSFVVHYRIQNRSSQAHPPFLIQDTTPYLRGEVSIIGVPRGVAAGEKIEMPVQRVCEAPCGPLKFGPFSIQVMDELGLFHVERLFDDKLEVQVVQTEAAASEELQSAEESPLVGDLETSRAGQGISLHGLREYRDGDPLSSIYWKKSTLDEHGFAVKEFERDITRRVAFLLAAEPRLHLGYGASSTWEIAKAYTLAQIRHYLEGQSSVSFISRSTQLQDVGGSQNLALFERALSYDFVQFASSDAGELNDELGAYASRLTPPCLIYFIVPDVKGHEEKWLKQLCFLKAQGFQPTAVLVSVSNSARMVGRRFGATWSFANIEVGNVEDTCGIFRNSGINAFWIGARDLNGRIGMKKHG